MGLQQAYSIIVDSVPPHVEEMVPNRRYIYGKVSAPEGEARFQQTNLAGSCPPILGRRAHYLKLCRHHELSISRTKDRRTSNIVHLPSAGNS